MGMLYIVIIKSHDNISRNQVSVASLDTTNLSMEVYERPDDWQTILTDSFYFHKFSIMSTYNLLLINKSHS